MTFEEKMTKLQEYYFRHGIIPTYRDMTRLFGIASTNSVFKFVKKAEAEGYIERVPVRLKPTNKFFI